MIERWMWVAVVSFAAALAGCDAATEGDLDDVSFKSDKATSAEAKALVGKLIFFDTSLSRPAGQSCASCHSPEAGYADPHADRPVSHGVDGALVGNRSAPCAAYAAYSPDFHYDVVGQSYVGGLFWDGRAANLVEQAKAPFLNPLEMRNPDRDAVVAKVHRVAYADLFRAAFGKASLDAVDAAYNAMVEAIAAYERTAEVNRFTSKYDFYLRGEVSFSDQELRGLRVFEDPSKGNCSACHPSTRTADGLPPLFTDFTYDNLGIPKNLESPFLGLPAPYNPDGSAYIDRGLGNIVKDPAQDGKFKVPSLRNVALTAPYGHNGYFKTLKDIVDFYNTRDVKPTWPAPEVAANVNREELGNLRLTDADVTDLLAFLATLSDGFIPPNQP